VTLERINELNPRTAMIGYSAVMTLWIVLFARTETELPAPLVLLLLLVPPVVHFRLGVLLTAFPGGPLVAGGVYLREWLERRDPAYVDPTLI